MPHISLEALALSIITIVIAVIITSAITIIIIIIISMRKMGATNLGQTRVQAYNLRARGGGENTTKKKLPSPSNQ
jgi:uncharacterized membrane protein (DUF106 family)